jgi:prepilin-type N-terminal cleavage/methylation domain-containing protein
MMRRGITLPELLLTLLILGVAAHLTITPFRRQVDAIVLSAGREEVIALFHRARMEARSEGHASLHFAEGGDALLLAPERPPFRALLRNRGIDLEIAGSRSEMEVVFGPLGMASVASATLILRRRDAETRLIVSAYGRVRR